MNNIGQYVKNLQEFFKSISFSRAIRVAIAVTLPAILGMQLGYFEIGMAISFGAFWSSPSDVIGSFRHKKKGILISSALILVVSLIKGYLHYELWILLPLLGLITFSIAFISVYGFRASLISFSGLMALVLSSAQDIEDLEIYQYALLIGTGGLWYLLLSKIWHRVNPKAETEEFLSETYLLTAEFLEIRGKLVDPKENPEELESELLKLQSKLTENHETLREILILSRKTSGWSNYQDKRLLIFVQLVEILETAIANPGNYHRMDRLFNDHPQYIKRFQDLIYEMSYQLIRVSEAGNNLKKLPQNDTLKQGLEHARRDVALLRNTKYYEEYLILQSLLDYQEKQVEKIKRIKWLLGESHTTDIEFIDRKTAKRFIAVQEYDPKILLLNFSFKSSIFRHSIRLAVTVIIGYMLGSLFEFQNPYSILLIIIVIMRPSYGLTRSRAKDRMIGTLIGAVIAFGMVFLIQNPIIYGTLGVISLVISLSLVQKNYKASATFITISAVFIYAILKTDVLDLIKFRVLDTLVGAALSFIAMRWLLPTWESLEIKESIEKSVQANKDYLHKIVEFYQLKGKIPTSYSIARKNAFLETSNLSSAFQRMAQEPKSKQREAEKIYELVVLNHRFLASLSSISTYIQHYSTTEASEHFKFAIEGIEENLEKVLLCLKDYKGEISNASTINDTFFEEQLSSLISFEISSLTSESIEDVRDLQEAHLIWEQLGWLYSMSSTMLKIAASVKIE